MGFSRRGSGWERLVRRVTSELAPDLPPTTEPTLARLLDLVCDWNARVDLTAARSA